MKPLPCLWLLSALLLGAPTLAKGSGSPTYVAPHLTKSGKYVEGHYRNEPSEAPTPAHSHPAKRDSDGRIERSSAARSDFQRQHPCPATGKTSGACSGYVVDHVKPLCAGGADSPGNMQWQSVADGKAKDRAERAQCAKR